VLLIGLVPDEASEVKVTFASHVRGWAHQNAQVENNAFTALLPTTAPRVSLTLTAYGTVRRSRPHGRDASPVIGLWMIDGPLLLVGQSSTVLPYEEPVG
jgi:hypothetical protein